jgi:hypothetical protein
MILRTAGLFLFSCSALTLTSCQNMGHMANPLDGVNRMIQAMGRSVGRLSADAKVDTLRIDPADIERAHEAELQRGALPESAPLQQTPSRENQLALAH